MPEIKQKAMVMQSEVSGQKVHLYVCGLGEVEGVTGQVGTEPAETVVLADPVDIHTVVLLDNSLSITEENQQRIYDILKIYIEGKDSSEKLSIAVFGEEIEYLAEEEADTQILLEALEKIEYKNQDSFLTDILYEELGRLESRPGYHRFIVATDGVDNKAIGYTKEELQESLKEKNYPIYSLGCVFKENGAELENLFSLSRLTRAEYFLVDEIQDDQAASESLNEEIRCLEVKLPDASCDGSEKSLLLTVNTPEGSLELTDKVTMPFKVREEKSENQEEAVPAEAASVAEEKAGKVPVLPEEETAEEALDMHTEFGEPVVQMKEEDNIDWISLGAMGTMIAALIFLVILQLKKKSKGEEKADSKSQKKEKKRGKKKNRMPQPEPFPDKPVQADPLPRVFLSGYDEEGGATACLDMEEESGTVCLDQSRYLVILKDIKDTEREFRYPLAGQVVVGRKRLEDVNIVLSHEQSVSARHCAISRDNERFFIEDLGSSNGTYLNGRRITGRTGLASGSTVRLGELELLVRLEEIR